MTKEEKQKAIDALKISVPIKALTQEEFNDYIQTLNKIMDWLEQEPNTWNLDDAREDFMSDVYNTLYFLPTNEEANRIIDSFDRVTSSIEQEPFINKPCVSEKVCEHDKQVILDKIAKTIEPLRHLSFDEMSGIEWDVLRVIDKYKSESEEI